MTIAMVSLTAVLAAATVVLAWATVRYMRAQAQPNVSGYFESKGSWIFLVIQNTGTDTAQRTRFSIDLSSADLADIYGPKKHGKRYIVYRDLSFLGHVVQLAPGQRIRHQWLFLPLALRDEKPRPCTLTVRYADRWKRSHTATIPFRIQAFGTWDTTYTPKPSPEERMAEALHKIEGLMGRIVGRDGESA